MGIQETPFLTDGTNFYVSIDRICVLTNSRSIGVIRFGGVIDLWCARGQVFQANYVHYRLW